MMMTGMMARAQHPSASERTAELELRALERMVGARCEQIGQWVQEAFAHGELASREADLQLEAFSERRAQAIRQLEVDSGEPTETRIARLERLLEAIDCSWAYFCPNDPGPVQSGQVREWAIMVR